MKMLSSTKAAWAKKFKKFPRNEKGVWAHCAVDIPYGKLLRTYGKPEEGGANNAVWYFLVPIDGSMVPARLMNIWASRRTEMRIWLLSFPTIWTKTIKNGVEVFVPVKPTDFSDWLVEDVNAGRPSGMRVRK